MVTLEDFFGQDLKVGDKVAAVLSTKNGRYMRHGVIVGFTPQFVKVQFHQGHSYPPTRVSSEYIIKAPNQ